MHVSVWADPILVEVTRVCEVAGALLGTNIAQYIEHSDVVDEFFLLVSH